MPLLTTATCRCYYTASEHADYDYLYDPVVHSYVVTDANGHSSYSYSDAPGRTLRVTDALGGSTRFTYDDMGQLLRSTDPDGFSTVYEYDLQGRLVRRTHPDAGVTAMTYDLAGHVVRQVDANGDTVTTDYHYDRQMAVHYSRHPQNDVTYSYGTAGIGRVVGIEDGSGMQTE